MDQRKIVLVNLSKSMLSEQDSRFIGMLITSRMFTMRQLPVPSCRRADVCHSISLSMSFRTSPPTHMTSILSEARKYGVSLTLAHQDQRSAGKNVAVVGDDQHGLKNIVQGWTS